jgi:hypothetical protein
MSEQDCPITKEDGNLINLCLTEWINRRYSPSPTKDKILDIREKIYLWLESLE